MWLVVANGSSQESVCANHGTLGVSSFSLNTLNFDSVYSHSKLARPKLARYYRDNTVFVRPYIAMQEIIFAFPFLHIKALYIKYSYTTCSYSIKTACGSIPYFN